MDKVCRAIIVLFLISVITFNPLSADQGAVSTQTQLTLMPNVEFQLISDQSTTLQQGLDAEADGQYRLALEIWESAAAESDQFNSAIGFEYIRLATEHLLTDKYESASEYYRQSLLHASEPQNRDLIRDELERLRPLAGEGLHRQWVSWLQSGDSQLGPDLVAFWVQTDPVPSNLYNERLIEHWERIAEAKANFQKESKMPYGADDRASVYVRYGAPDDISSGTLKVNPDFIGNWLAWQIEHSIDSPSDSLANPDRSPGENESVRDLESYLLPYHENPEYEIWTYNTVTTFRNEPLIFIFGTDGQSGEFRQLSSIDDTIPRRAYGANLMETVGNHDMKMGRFSPALLLQMVYYQQLASIDPWFGYRLVSIRDAYLDRAHFDSADNLDQIIRNRNRESLESRLSRAPVKYSDMDKSLQEIPIDIYQYRRLDEENNPYLLVLVESRANELIQNELSLRTGRSASGNVQSELNDNLLDDFEIRQSFQVYNNQWEIDQQVMLSPQLTMSDVAGFDNLVSVYSKRYVAPDYQSVSVELYQTGENVGKLHPLLPTGLRGIGRIYNRQPVPLLADSSYLEMADLMIGFEDDLPANYPFDYRVSNQKSLPVGKNLILHFEVYHLQPGTDDRSEYELTYRIIPIVGSGRVMSGRGETSLTLHYEINESMAAEDLEIETQSLGIGNYELQVVIEDLESGQSQNRTVQFRVVDEEMAQL